MHNQYDSKGKGENQSNCVSVRSMKRLYTIRYTMYIKDSQVHHRSDINIITRVPV